MKLYEHQKQALEATAGKPNCAFYHAMGSGKTFTGSERAIEYGGPILVCCQRSKTDDWLDHFAEQYGWSTYDLSKPKEAEAFRTSKEEKRVGVISYDTLWRREPLLKMRGLTLICDESSLISNERAKRTRAILNMDRQGRIDHVVLLSGTPTDGKYERLLSQAWLLGWRIKKTDYWDRYVVTRNLWLPGQYQPIRTVAGYKNVEELKAKLRELGSHFLTAEECLGSLPEQTFTYVRTPAPANYKKMLKTGICVQDGEELVGNDPLSKRLYLRQLCGQYNDKRYESIAELLETTEERVVVFYNYLGEKKRLLEVCEKLKKPVSEVSGQKKDLTAYENEPESVTLIQYQAGAMGLNLQKARITIYASLPDRSELYEQSKSRTWRTGQTRPCSYYVCKCPNTIEDDVEDALKQKKDYTDALFRTKYGEAE